MRRILVEHARRRNLKRGAGFQHVSLQGAGMDLAFDGPAVSGVAGDVELLALDDALNALAQHDPRKVRVVEMRSFAGLSVEETAEVLGISPITVKREWRAARAWLFREMGGTDESGAMGADR